MKIAVIDDWQNNARNFADWSRVEVSHQLDFYSDHLSGTALIERLAPYDILCVMRERTVFSEDVIAQLPALKAVITSGMRNAGLDLAAFSARNIKVSGTESPGHATSELAMIFIGMLARQTVANANSMSGTGWQVATGRDLRGATLGILGLGRLGRQLADLAKAFGMNVQAWSQNLTAETCAEQGVTYADKEQFFATSDFISLHLKLSPRVTGIVGAAELSLMKPDSYLVNTSRGPLIDVPALCDALRAGQIAGAAIDVFDVEPLPADDVMRKTPNLLMTPHIGYVTNETMSIFYGQTCESLEAYLAGSPIRLLSA
jgi:phosphoglycerate dehydrogenase-like enzyme